VVSSTPRPHFTPGKDPAPIVQEAGWAPGPVWTGGISRLHRDSIPGRPARSQSLYRMSYTQTHTHTHTHTYTVGLLLTSDQPVAEAATYRTHNKHKRRTFMPSVGFEPAIPAIMRPKTFAWELTLFVLVFVFHLCVFWSFYCLSFFVVRIHTQATTKSECLVQFVIFWETCVVELQTASPSICVVLSHCACGWPN